LPIFFCYFLDEYLIYSSFYVIMMIWKK